MKRVRGPDIVMRGAAGELIRHYERVEVLHEVSKQLVRLHLEVADAGRALLSVSAMVDAGWQVNFENGNQTVTNGVNNLILTRSAAYTC